MTEEKDSNLSQIVISVHDKLNTNFWNDKKKDILNKQINKYSDQRISPLELVEKLINDE